MASKPTNYAVYTTEDDGKSLSFVGEQEAYNRKEAIGKLLADEQNAELRRRIESQVSGADRPTVADTGEPAPDVAFVISPVTSFHVIKPKVETRVEVTFG